MLIGKGRVAILLSVCVLAVGSVAFVPPIAQPATYHSFADSREWFGVPNVWNVVSNVPFLVVGLLGLAVVSKNQYRGGLPSQRLAYVLFFAGVALVCFGSSYYHWSPSNATLMWDRLPMSVAFMAIVAALIGEHVSERAGKWLLAPLIVLGVASVLYWNYTETLGRGDLRLYGLVQFLSLIVIALLLTMFPSRLSGKRYLWYMFAGYAVAKLLEEFDAAIFNFFGGQMSGHALKHAAAAIGMYFFVVALRERRLVPNAS